MENEINETLEAEFIIPSTLSAMAKKFYVKSDISLKQNEWYIKQGSTVTGVKVIAQGMKIRVVNSLIENYLLPNGEKTKIEDWYKCRGTALVTDGTVEEIREVHWYQCKEIGKIDFKMKLRGEKEDVITV